MRSRFSPAPFVLAVGALGVLWQCASGATYAQRGDELLAQGNTDGARDEYFRALEEEPEMVRAHLGLAETYLAEGRLDDADNSVTRALSIKETTNAVRLMAQVRYEQRNYQEAGKLLDAALQKKPEDAGLHFVLGLVRRDAGDLERAADAFEMVLTLDPKRVDARVEFAAILQRLKRYQDALDVLNEASKQVQGKLLTRIYTAKGQVHEAMGMADYAEHDYGLALKRDSGNVLAKAGIGRALRSAGKMAESVEFLQEAAKAHPENYVIHYELGVSFKEFRLEDQAVEPLMKAVSFDESKPETYVVLIPVLENKPSMKDELYDIRKKAAKASPEDIELQLQLGRASHEREDPQTTEAAMQRVLEIEQSNVEANFLLGMAHVRMGNREAAVEDLEALRYIDHGKADELMAAIERADAPDSPGKAKRRKNKAKRRRRKAKRRRK